MPIAWYYMNMMQRTMRIKLQPTAAQEALLLPTVAQYTQSFNQVCVLADAQHLTNGVALHHATYYGQKESTQLPSQLIVSARMKATEAIKSVMELRKKRVKNEAKRQAKCLKQGKVFKPKSPILTPHSKQAAIRYDARSYKFDRAAGTVSLLHVQQPGQVRNRITIPVAIPEYYQQYLTADWQSDSADLIYRKGSGWWLHVVVSCAAPFTAATGKVVGVDVGVSRIAVTSNARFFGGKQVKETNNKYFRLRRALQAKGTKSARRHLKKLSGKIARFQRHANYVVSKAIVGSAKPGDIIAMEDLTDIRERTQYRREQRRAMSNWSFAQLQRFVEDKAEAVGISVQYVDARYSSQECLRCGYISKANRPCQSEFKCKKCGYALNADLKAARTLAGRAICAASGPR
jgi:putative transposase